MEREREGREGRDKEGNTRMKAGMKGCRKRLEGEGGEEGREKKKKILE